MKNATTTTLESLERRHAELLTQAGQAPAGSQERERLLREADIALRRINEWCEASHPTPLK